MVKSYLKKSLIRTSKKRWLEKICNNGGRKGFNSEKIPPGGLTQILWIEKGLKKGRVREKPWIKGGPLQRESFKPGFPGWKKKFSQPFGGGGKIFPENVLFGSPPGGQASRALSQKHFVRQNQGGLSTGIGATLGVGDS